MKRSSHMISIQRDMLIWIDPLIHSILICLKRFGNVFYLFSKMLVPVLLWFHHLWPYAFTEAVLSCGVLGSFTGVGMEKAPSVLSKVLGIRRCILSVGAMSKHWIFAYQFLAKLQPMTGKRNGQWFRRFLVAHENLEAYEFCSLTYLHR